MLEHYNRASSSKMTARVEETISNEVLDTPQSQELKKQIMKNFGNYFIFILILI